MSEKRRDEPAEPSRPRRGESRRVSLVRRLTPYWRWAVRVYATADPRSLGVFRIALGLLLFEDVARRYPDLVSFYTNLGWLTNHFAMYQPMSNYIFSIHHAFSTPAEVHVIFAIHLLVNFAFLIGYRTKLMHFLAWFLLTSLNSRNVMVENGGFVMLQLLVLYTLFLPLGGRFSVDSFVASYRAKRETSVAQLSQRVTPSVTPIAHFAVTMVILQWATNYYLNTVQKNGPTWHDGTALHYFMQQGRLMRPFGFWLRDHIPFALSSFLTRVTLIVEGSIVVLWLTPYFTKPARMLAWFLSIGLHLSITLFARLGPFSWTMMIAYVMFIPAEVWEWFGERHRHLRRKVLCLLDEASPWSISVGRVIERLDLLRMVRFRGARDEARKSSFSVGIKKAGKTDVARGAVAVARVLQALPTPGFALVLFKGLGLHHLFGWGLDRAMHRRARLTESLGLATARPPPPRANRDSAGWRAARLGRNALATLCLLGLLALGVSQVLVENRIVPAWAKPNRPEWVVALVVYPRLFQGWSMFAPDPPREDGWMIVDGRTVDGRKLDPTTGKEPNFSMDLPGGPDFSAQWGAFHMRIFENRFRVYYNGVRDYLLRTHEINGKPEDRLVAFDAWYLSRMVGPPGGPHGPVNYRKLFSYGRVRDSGLPAEAKDRVIDDTRPAPAAASPQPRREQHGPRSVHGAGTPPTPQNGPPPHSPGAAGPRGRRFGPNTVGRHGPHPLPSALESGTPGRPASAPSGRPAQ